MCYRKAVLTIGLVVSVLFGSPAFAYIDPGTGSLIIQWLFGGVIAALAFGELYWNKAKAYLFGKSKSSQTTDEADEKHDDAIHQD